MEKDNYEYETKCRRCGNFQEWYFAKKDNLKLIDFLTAMSDYAVNPRLQKCSTCDKRTIQDLISYNT